MRKTPFAGLLVPEPGESISEDNGSFFTDRDTIDHLLEVGTKTHRHNGLAGLANPIVAPGVSVVASGGTIPADQSISVGYTLEDANGGETMLSNVTVVSTPPPVQAPGAAPGGAFASDAGSLLVNTYFYVLTFTDGEGGETPFGASLQVERPPGFASGHIELSNLTFGMEEAGATGWRLYRAVGGAAYGLLATGGIGDDTFDDDGSVGLDCSQHPPVEENTTVGINQLMVTLPSAGLGSAAFINLYATVTGDFSGGSFLAQAPVASAGMTMIFSVLELGEESPPDVNLSIGGAHQIDPDTELLDWHWKRPVATVEDLPEDAEEGDVRAILGASRPTLFQFLDGEWQSLSATPTRGWVKVSTANLAKAAMASASLDPGCAAGHLLMVKTNRQARVRVYGDSEARSADAARPIGTDPTGDHGVQLDYVVPSEGGGEFRLTPVIFAANLDDPAKSRLYMNITNEDSEGVVDVEFLVLPIEVV